MKKLYARPEANKLSLAHRLAKTGTEHDPHQ